MAVQQDILIYKGEAVALTFTMTPLTNITGWTIALSVKINATDTGDVIFKTPASITDAPNGVFQFLLTHADTLIAAQDYQYDIQRTDASSEAVLSIGTFQVQQEVLYP